MMRRTSVWILSLALLPLTASAQTTAEVEATWRLLVQQAQAAQSTGDHARALDLGLRAVSIHSSPSLYRFVAQEQSQLGLVVPALTSAQRCVDALTADRNAPERAATMATCTALVRDLQGRVGHLVVDVPGPAPSGLTVTVAGSELPPALYGVPYLVTPGHVTIDATAPGRVALHRSVDVAAAGTVPVRIELATATPATATPVTPTPATPVTPTPTPVTPTPVTPTRPIARPVAPSPVVASPGSLHRSMAWATAIGGGVGLVLGAVLTGVREGAVSSFNGAGCIEDHGVATPTGNCPGDQSTANSLAPAVIASFAVGGALVAASVVLWVTAPSRGREHAAFACSPSLGTTGLVCGARF